MSKADIVVTANMAKKPIQLADYIRDVPDFPKPGILFRDIPPWLAKKKVSEAALKFLVNLLSDSMWITLPQWRPVG